ncbi:alpha-ketoglutarate-dependent dioxygenase AlkB [Nocardioides limicola]|uniref:alpha-ketoglutarate-dependent dioxygenase AlkB n=1 Tax=Nocardioides limicola TaxID=2803368 RepID=UPI0027DB0130|nr:alpha-ketoglutarate-dependent dioxygenase AlkB [Nocardioides sp. DJM-14]
MEFQGTLFADQGFADLAEIRRTELDAGAWVDVLPGWAPTPDDLFAEIAEAIPWRAERRWMYHREVDVPRLVHIYGPDDVLPHRALIDARQRLSRHYLPELGEPFVTAGCCLYRDGRDSVAWHGDTIGRGRHENTMVAILSLGDERQLAVRPVGGGPARRFPVGHGDLLVMGGSCQRTHEHAVLKTSRPVGPRISVQFRPLDVF